MFGNDLPFTELMGKTLTNIQGSEGDDELVFTTTEGKRYKLYHSQDCCEHVSLNEVVGSLTDLIGSPLVEAEEVSSDPGVNEDIPPNEYADSYTWTFYKLRTAKGAVILRWLGTSNGYYSESVNFVAL